MVRRFTPASVMDGSVTGVSEVIPDAGNWLQQHTPELVTQHLVRWLESEH